MPVNNRFNGNVAAGNNLLSANNRRVVLTITQTFQSPVVLLIGDSTMGGFCTSVPFGTQEQLTVADYGAAMQGAVNVISAAASNNVMLSETYETDEGVT